MKKILLNIAGGICLIFAVVGIAVPVLPTTPFVLVAAACFACNKKVYQWLVNSKVFGPYLRHYRYKTGVPIATKICSLVFLWVMLAISIVFVNILWVRILLASIGAAVSAHILFIKTKPKVAKEKDEKIEETSENFLSSETEETKIEDDIQK